MSSLNERNGYNRKRGRKGGDLFMGEKKIQTAMSCPKCGKTILPEDKFCFHCGRRLTNSPATHGPGNQNARPVRRRFSQWPLAIFGAGALILAAVVVAHGSHVIAQLGASSKPSPARLHHSIKHKSSTVLHSAVTTTTTYPSNLPSSGSWTPEVETYNGAQITLRLPAAMSHAESSGATKWVWGAVGSPYQVTLAVVTGRSSSATIPLGPNTFGTAIIHAGGVTSQSLYVKWSNNDWIAVQMQVPNSHRGWLGSIAESVRIS